MTELTVVTRSVKGLNYTDEGGETRPISVTLEATDKGPLIKFRAKRMKKCWSKPLIELIQEMTSTAPVAKPIVKVEGEGAEVLRFLKAKIFIDAELKPPLSQVICDHIDELMQDYEK